MRAELSAEQKRKAAEVDKKLRKGLLQAIAVLDSDVSFARAQWLISPNSQFWRRTLIRCCCTSVEGTMSLLKQVSPNSADYFGVCLTEADLKVVTERRTYVEAGVTKTKTAFLPFRDNVKETFKVFAKAHTIQPTIDYNVTGFAELCEAFELRNRLMHPKTVFDLGVNDKELNKADRGLKWFKKSLVQLLNDCGEKKPFPTRTS